MLGIKLYIYIYRDVLCVNGITNHNLSIHSIQTLFLGYICSFRVGEIERPTLQCTYRHATCSIRGVTSFITFGGMLTLKVKRNGEMEMRRILKFMIPLSLFGTLAFASWVLFFQSQTAVVSVSSSQPFTWSDNLASDSYDTTSTGFIHEDFISVDNTDGDLSMLFQAEIDIVELNATACIMTDDYVETWEYGGSEIHSGDTIVIPTGNSQIDHTIEAVPQACPVEISYSMNLTGV